MFVNKHFGEYFTQKPYFNAFFTIVGKKKEPRSDVFCEAMTLRLGRVSNLGYYSCLNLYRVGGAANTVSKVA